MKKKTGILAFVLIVLLLGSYVAYQSLSARYLPDAATSAGADATSSDTAAASAESTANDTTAASAESTANDTTAASTDASASEATAEANPAADFTVYDRAGNAVKLSDHFGKPIVISFWASWCGPCVSELPMFDKVYQEYGEDVEFMMVNITDGGRETVEVVEDFLQAEAYRFPVYLDKDLEAAYTYEAYTIPLAIFIDADGNIVHQQIGAMSEAVLRSFLDGLLGTNGM